MLSGTVVKLESDPKYSEKRWWQREGDDLGQAVWELGTGLAEDQQSSVQKAHDLLCMYYGDESTDLGPLGRRVAPRERDDDLDYGLIQILCDTVHSEIAGRQKPVPKVQTSGADWATKRTAKKIEKFCVAHMHQQQGIYLNVWEQMESCFLDGAIIKAGVLKVFGDPEAEKIRFERHFFHELHVDAVDAKYGDPQNLFHVYTMERDKAIEAFVTDDLSKKEQDAILYAIETAPEGEEKTEPGHYGRISKSVKIVESWRLPLGKNKPGKHVFAIQNKLLYEEEWTRPEFPFVIIRWNPHRIGWGSKALSEEVESIHDEVNFNVQKLQERFRVCGGKRTFYEEGSISEPDLQANDAEVFVPVKKGAQIPKENKPSPIAESEVEWTRMNIDFGFRRSGVSEMRASARKEPGVDSGVAIRTLNDMQTARFALKAKAYENAYVQLTRQIIYVAKEMHEAGISIAVQHKRDKINWADVELPDSVTLDISIAPTASLPNDPAGRMQMAQELSANGLIGPETFKQLLGWPDLEKEMNSQTAQMDWVEMAIDTMLDGGDYIDPDGMITDKPGAMLQVVNAYFHAMYEEAPEPALASLRRWIGDIDSQIKRAEDAAAKAAAERAAMAGQVGGGMPPGAGGMPQA